MQELPRVEVVHEQRDEALPVALVGPVCHVLLGVGHVRRELRPPGLNGRGDVHHRGVNVVARQLAGHDADVEAADVPEQLVDAHGLRERGVRAEVGRRGRRGVRVLGAGYVVVVLGRVVWRDAGEFALVHG